MRIFNPFRSSMVLIFFRNQPVIWGLVDCRRAGHHAEGGVCLLPELEPVGLMEPCEVALGVHAQWHRGEPLEGAFLARPVVGAAVEGLHRALGTGVEDADGGHELAAGEDLDLQAAARQLVDHLPEALGVAQEDVVGRRPHRGHAPLEPGLGDHVRGVHDGRRGRCRQRAAGLSR